MTNETIDVKTTHNNDILCQEFNAALTRFWRRTNRLHRDREIALVIVVEWKLEKRRTSRRRHSDEKRASKKSWKIVKILKTIKSARSKRTIYEKTKLEKKRQEREDVFYVEADLRLIFAQPTTHFRIHSAKSTAFLIHERWSLSMNSMINSTISDARNEDFTYEIKIISRDERNHSQW
jgi:hypothetical protein